MVRRVVELTAQPLGRALRQYLRTHLEAWETGDAGDHSHFSSSGEDPARSAGQVLSATRRFGRADLEERALPRARPDRACMAPQDVLE